MSAWPVLDWRGPAARLAERLWADAPSLAWWARAGARVTAQIISPCRTDPDFADLTMVVGLVGLRRLRPIATLPVFRSLVSTGSAIAPARPLMSGAAKTRSTVSGGWVAPAVDAPASAMPVPMARCSEFTGAPACNLRLCG
jgi:hypothetical protein